MLENNSMNNKIYNTKKIKKLKYKFFMNDDVELKNTLKSATVVSSLKVL